MLLITINTLQSLSSSYILNIYHFIVHGENVGIPQAEASAAKMKTKSERVFAVQDPKLKISGQMYTMQKTKKQKQPVEFKYRL